MENNKNPKPIEKKTVIKINIKRNNENNEVGEQKKTNKVRGVFNVISRKSLNKGHDRLNELLIKKHEENMKRVAELNKENNN